MPCCRVPRRPASLALTTTLFLATALASAAAPAGAQELSLLAGTTDTDDHTHATYGWQLQFQQPLSPHLAVSLDWINEGHMPAHRRDGVAMQAWLTTPAWRQRLRASVGVGPYLYFDTEPNARPSGYGDHHGLGAVLSAAATLRLGGPWALHLQLNEIRPSGDVDTRTVMLGVGYHFDGALRTQSQAGTGGRPQDLQVFVGGTTVNSLEMHKSTTWGVDYQLSLWRWLYGGATWFHDTSDAYAPNDRLAVQLRAVHESRNLPLQLSAGVGLFQAVGHADPGTTVAAGSPEGLLLLRAGWHVGRRGSLDANWYRSFTTDDHDLDIITVGYTWHFGR